MRPTTRHLLSAPFGDFPFVLRMLQECKTILPDWPEDLILSLMKLVCFQLSDRASDTDILSYIRRYRSYRPAEMQESILSSLIEQELIQSTKYDIPLYTSTSTYWKNKSYGLNAAEIADESRTAIGWY